MRAVFCHEVSNGKEAYSLWRSAGKPDVTYPHAENDAYWLHIELNGYLVPLGQSEYDLIHSSGKKPAYQKLYGSLKAREEQMNQARTGSGPTLHELFSKEMDEIERMGGDEFFAANWDISVEFADESVMQSLKNEEVITVVGVFNAGGINGTLEHAYLVTG